MKKGFTLLELIIVIVIIGILASVALPRYFAQVETARKAEAVATMRSIRGAELAYYSKNGAYTGTLPISVDIDDDGKPDVYVAVSSPNFTFTLELTVGYIKATKVTGAKDYYMCIDSAKITDTTAPTTCQ